jgi:predicted AAA+ superfamily ATPase
MDEFQQMPELFPVLRVLADRKDLPARFLILGSASPDLMKGASETLAGRVQFLEMTGFALQEVGSENLQNLWLRGGFPESYLGRDNAVSSRWRRSFIHSFLVKDIPSFGVRASSETLRRFWGMMAHLHGQTWNASTLASSLDVSQPTVRHYLDILSDALVLRQLPPWLPNSNKRLVKAPKVYLRDSGLLHSLIQVESMAQLQSHPIYGASWEGFAIEEICRVLELVDGEVFFWGTHGGAEIDLVVRKEGKLFGFEFKATEKPSVTKSMTIALKDLGLERIFLVYPGEMRFELKEGMEAIGLARLADLSLIN